MSGETTTTAKQWFVVHTYSGFENKVAEAIQSRAKIFGMAEKITRVLVPTEKVVEVRNKQKRETEQKFFPGYVLVEMELTDDTWHLVRSTPKVTGFREAEAEVGLPARRQGAGHRRPVRQLSGRRRGHQPGTRAHEGRGAGLRAADAGGARVLPGGATVMGASR